MRTKILVVKDSLSFLKKRKLFAVCLMLFSTLYGMFINLYISETSEWRKKEASDYYGYYRVCDNLVGEYEKEFLKKDNAIQALILLCNLMHKTQNGKYIELYDNPIFIESGYISNDANEWKDTKAGIELPNRGNTLFDQCNCLWCGSNVKDEFKLEIAKGDWFSEENYVYMLPTTAVIIGASFSNVLSVGDEVAIENYFGNTKGTVVGILKADQYVIYGDSVINLNNYLLIPLHNVKEEETTLFDSFRIKDLYLMKINGEYTNVESIDSLQQELNNLYKMADIYPPAQVGMSPYAISLTLKTNLHTIVMFIGSVGVALSIISIILTSLFLAETHRRNMGVYSAMITCGYTSKMLKVIDCFLYLIPTISGVIPVLVVSRCQKGKLILIAVLILEVVIVFMMIIRIWRKKPIVNYLQESSNARL